MAVRSQFEEQLVDLQQQLMIMGRLVEEAVHKAVKSLVEKDIELAQTVVEGDAIINEAELEIERNCFSLIALQQPVGRNLRKIATTLKVATDLERMADHAVSIAETTITLKDERYAKPLIDIPRMGDLVQKMVYEALDAFIQMDQVRAVKIAKQDDEIDACFQQIFTDLIEIMNKDKALISQATYLLLAAQYLERIADYTTNICEWIVYLSEGKMVELN